MHKQYTEISLEEFGSHYAFVNEKDGEYDYGFGDQNEYPCKHLYINSDSLYFIDYNQRGKPSIGIFRENNQHNLLSFLPFEENSFRKTTLPIDHPAFAAIKVDQAYNEWNKTSTYPKNKYWRPSTTFLNFYNQTAKVHPVGSRYPKQTFLRLLKKLDEGKALFEDDFHQFDALANQLIEEDFRSIGGLKPVEK